MAGLIELAFVFCAALGWGIFELVSLKRLKKARTPNAEDQSQRS